MLARLGDVRLLLPSVKERVKAKRNSLGAARAATRRVQPLGRPLTALEGVNAEDTRAGLGEPRLTFRLRL
jgi:hypothetical protein